MDSQEMASLNSGSSVQGWADRARSLRPLIEAAAPRIEAARELTDDVLDALHEARLFRLLIPASAGGEEADPVSYVEMIEAIAMADASTAWCLGQGSGSSMIAAYLPHDSAWQIFGTDPRAVLAWGAGAAGQARVTKGGYIVNGTWQFASGIRHATWLGGHCRVIEPDGSIRTGPDGAPVERTMLFPKSEARTVDVWRVMGLRGTGSDTYSVENLFVPEEFSAIRDLPAERRCPGPLYSLSTHQIFAASFAAVALGIARAMLDTFETLARTKSPREVKQTLRDNAAVQCEVGLAEARLGAARSYLIDSLRNAWEWVQHGEPITMAHRIRIRLASTYAIHEAREVAARIYHEAGATAIFESQPFERRLRDINTVSQQVQGRRAHFETGGQFYLGLTPVNAFL